MEAFSTALTTPTLKLVVGEDKSSVAFGADV